MPGLKELVELPGQMGMMGVSDVEKDLIKSEQKKLRDYQEAIMLARDIEDYGIKNKKELSKVIGPVSGMIARSPIRGIVAKFKPEYGPTAKTMQGKILNLMNPVRKEVTGAAAAYKELVMMIEPMFGQMTDVDADAFLQNNRNVQWLLMKKTQDTYRSMQQMAPNKDWSTHILPATKKSIDRFKQMSPKEKGKYFFQTPESRVQPMDVFQEASQLYSQ